MSTNAVIYARFSSDKQREESIDGQIRECKAFAQANQLNVIAIYIDRAMSARTDHRPDFLRMIKDSRSGSFDYVLVYQLDRFSRSRYDSAIYKHELKKNGVKVLSAKENITDSPTGIMLEAMLEGYAEYYSAELSQKVRRGMTENLLEHKWNGSPVPLGYALDADHRLVIDPDMAPHVKTLFDMFLAGKSYAELARYLDEKHIRTVTGRKYTGPTVHNLMSRQLYTGTYTWGGQVIEDFCPAIISKSDFARAALRMTNRKRTAKDGIPMSVRRSPEYALTGIIYCGECGRTMTGYSGRGQNGDRYYYYRCNSNNNRCRQTEKIKCKNHPIRRNRLEDLVLQTTVNILSDKEAVAAIAEQVSRIKLENPYASELSNIKSQLADLKKRHDNSVKAIEAGVMSQAIMDNVCKYEAEIDNLKARQEKIKLATPSLQIDPVAVEYFLKSLLLNKKQHDKYRLDLFEAFIHRVVVYHDKVEIQYNYLPGHKLENPITTPLPGCSNLNKVVGLFVIQISQQEFFTGSCQGRDRSVRSGNDGLTTEIHDAFLTGTVDHDGIETVLESRDPNFPLEYIQRFCRFIGHSRNDQIRPFQRQRPEAFRIMTVKADDKADIAG